MNRRDFLKQLGLIAALPLVGLSQATHTIGGWFKESGEWGFAAVNVSAEGAERFKTEIWVDGDPKVMVFVCGPPALSDEQIDFLYQESRGYFGV